ncbi:hypothetical protein BTM36_19465 [Herbaspirillum sp. VT-16-41]|nr:hypothetical protein BTM36_19465 [Herbaspirillum sp. VT-16-41]
MKLQRTSLQKYFLNIFGKGRTVGLVVLACQHYKCLETARTTRLKFITQPMQELTVRVAVEEDDKTRTAKSVPEHLTAQEQPTFLALAIFSVPSSDGFKARNAWTVCL